METTRGEQFLIHGAHDMTEAVVPLSKDRAIELEERLRTLSIAESTSRDDQLHLGKSHMRKYAKHSNPNFNQCPHEGLQFESDSREMNMSCVLRKKTDKECNETLKYFGAYMLKPDPLTCGLPPSRPICTFLTEFRFSARDKVDVRCWRDVCIRSPIYLGCFDPKFGTIDDEETWFKFETVGLLELELPAIVTQNSMHGFNYCLLSCREGERKVKQALVFPPILKRVVKRTQRSTKKINVNIVLEDSVSRSHFYRFMPKSVQSLRDIFRDSSFHATVLDFELVQSYAAFTLPNAQFLMAGRSFKEGGKSQRRINGIGVLTDRFKRFGYQTLIHEDLCWFDYWGSFLSPSYKKNLKPFTEGFRRAFESYKQMTNLHLDDKGLSFLSCDILKDLGLTNPFGGHHDRKMCWDGRLLSEYLIAYVRRFLSLVERNQDAAPALAYTHLNTGHENSGKRIRTDDLVLSKFLEDMARNENTLTILLSDHGGKTTKYAVETLQGSLEVFSPMLFMIIPDKVSQWLGKTRMETLILNQKRLVTFADLHHTLLSVLELTENTNLNKRISGLFLPVPLTRTCADIKGLHSDVMCRCDGWRKFLSPKSLDMIWLAEFALGQINNMIQSQRLQGMTRREIEQSQGFGKCARFLGKSIERPRQMLIGKHYLTTLVLVVEPAYGLKSKERFEVQLKYSTLREHSITFVKYTRLSFYSRYKNCADKGVDVTLCACAIQEADKPEKPPSVEVLIQGRHFIEYGVRTTTRFLESKCLLITVRHVKRFVISKKQTRLMSFEVANVCHSPAFRVKLGGIHRVTRFSRALPISAVIKPKTIHFLLTVLNGWKYGVFRPVVMHSPVRN